MQYQFDNAPSLEAIIPEFGINRDRLHLITCAIQEAAWRVSDDDFEWGKDHYTPNESAYLLKQANLMEAFALLCSLPGRTSADLHLFAECDNQRPLPMIKASARFDKFGKLERWDDSSRFNGWALAPWEYGWMNRSPAENAADAEWVTARRAEADKSLGAMYELSELPAVVALSTHPLSGQQWRRKFVAERWYRDDLRAAERLVDPEDSALWKGFVDRESDFPEVLEKFLEWAADQHTWDQRMPTF